MKKTITPSTVEVANIQALPDLVVGQASSLKQTFDKTGADTNEYINDVLIPELNGNDGANKIGLSLYLSIHTSYSSFRSTISYHLLELNAIISYN